MCNLYASMTGRRTLIDFVRNPFKDRTGNLPFLPSIFPDTMAPVLRNSADGGEFTMRWGMPGRNMAERPSPIFAT